MSKPKKRPRANGEEVPLFAEGTPLDEHGLPLSEAEIPEDEARNMPLDAEGSRQLQQYRQAASRKAAGERKVVYNGPDPAKYNLAASLHPEARVRIYQLEPEPDHRWPEKYVAQLRDYEALRAHVTDNMWNGERAVFKWEVHGGGGFAFASGSIPFREDEMRKYPQQPPNYSPNPYQMPPPYGVPPLAGYAPPMHAPPMQFVPQPQVQQQAPPQAQPAPQMPPTPIQLPAGLDPVVGSLIQMLITQLNDSNARLAAMSAQQYYAPPAAPAQVVMPVAPPPAQKSPLDQLLEMSAMLGQMNKIHANIRHEFGGDDSGADAAPAPLQSDEGFPLKVKDFGAVRAVADKDDNVTYPLFANIDKAGSLLDNLFDKVKKLFHDVSEDRVKNMREQLSIMKEVEAISNRAQQQRALGSGQAPSAAQSLQSQTPTQTPTQPSASAPPAPQANTAAPEHPWEKFGKPRSPETDAPPQAESAPTAPEPTQQVVEAPAEVAD